MISKCKICDVEFKSKPSENRLFCSRACNAIDKKRRARTNCLNCSVEFEFLISKKKTKYCSLPCAIEHRRGKKRPKTSETYAKARSVRNQKIHDEYGEIVIKLLANGAGLEEIARAIGKGPIPTRKYLVWASLRDVQLANSKKICSNQAKSIAKLGGDGAKRSITKELTKEICDWYKAKKDGGMFCMEICKELKKKFGYGQKKYLELVALYGRGAENPQTGTLNAQYGMAPPPGAGNGCQGWLFLNGQKVFFRSFLEMRIFLYLHKHDVPIILCKHRIKYKDGDGDIDRTYNPDIVIDTTIYEIKPSKMIKLESVQKKWEALKLYAMENNLSCGFITEKTFELETYTKESIDNLIESGILKPTNDKHYHKLLRQL